MFCYARMEQEEPDAASFQASQSGGAAVITGKQCPRDQYLYHTVDGSEIPNNHLGCMKLMKPYK